MTGLLLCIIGLTFVQTFDKHEARYANQVAVLMYHHIHDEDTSSSTITTQLFHDQLEYLQKNGHHFISLDEYKQFMGGSSVPDNAVMVTFDDGYESFYTNAFPVLKQLHIPAVNFIITGTLDHPLDDIPAKLSREQIIEMTTSSNLIDAQCHTNAFHDKRENGQALLLKDSSETDQQYVERMTADTQACIANVKQVNPREIDALAYPYGIYDDQTAQVVRGAGVRYAFTIEPLMALRSDNPLKIPRINAGNPQVSPQGLNSMIAKKIVTILHRGE
jgi:peptidoglycan/xylan/chitin deacetylase (PgdA/CDA1 family)